jgi:hypothetical protein
VRLCITDRDVAGRTSVRWPGEYVVGYWHPSATDEDPKFQTHHKFDIGWDVWPGQVPQARYNTLGEITHALLVAQDINYKDVA